MLTRRANNRITIIQRPMTNIFNTLKKIVRNLFVANLRLHRMLLPFRRTYQAILDGKNIFIGFIANSVSSY